MRRWRRSRALVSPPSKCGSSARAIGCASGGSESGMTDQLDPYVEWIAREAKRPVAVDPMAVERVMARVRLAERPSRRAARWPWFVEPRSLPLSPIVGAALAAGLVGIGVFLGHLNIDRGGQNPTGRSETVAPRPPLASSRDTSIIRDTSVIKFVLV